MCISQRFISYILMIELSRKKSMLFNICGLRYTDKMLKKKKCNIYWKLQCVLWNRKQHINLLIDAILRLRFGTFSVFSWDLFLWELDRNKFKFKSWNNKRVNFLWNSCLLSYLLCSPFKSFRMKSFSKR